jgi:hypothetical protein
MTENPIPWRVIRAAPELLEALHNLAATVGRVASDKFKDYPILEADLNRARAAIARAKGEKE